MADQHNRFMARSTSHTDYITESPGGATGAHIYHGIYRYSSLKQLLRVTAFCLRACDRFKKLPSPPLAEIITPQELIKARVFWIKATQAAYFKDELKLLSSSKLHSTHPFNRLMAYIDTQGVIRVGGRLNRSTLELESIHPSILPRQSKLTDLIIADAHQQTLHGGTQPTLTYIRSAYWIIGGRGPVRSHILRCVSCARQRGIQAQQQMGQLPAARVTPSRAFSHTGVDYAGPVTIKSWKGRGAKQHKGWLWIFVCFSTSAVHLEVVSDYSTDAFIAASKRFTARRGIFITLYGDCGTTFKGADHTLSALFTKGVSENNELITSIANEGTTWKFNPPAAPHMGGKWGATVKSVKHHLNRTVGDTVLTFEELTTLFAQIESILNSRPLESLSDDPEDISALTPGHFLIGEPIKAIPEPSLLDLSKTRLSRWQFIQQQLQSFWAQWSKQYLQRHLSTTKWHHPSHQIKVGSLVLITNEHCPPSKWPLARITHLHPGKDGLRRVVTLRTSTTTLVRPIIKLAILPVIEPIN